MHVDRSRASSGPSRLVHKLRGSLARRGSAGTLRFGIEHVHTLIARWADGAFDRRWGTDTRDRVTVDALGIVGDGLRDAAGYRAITEGSFERMLTRAGRPDRAAVFVDLGCGKGRALMMASRRYRQVVGVELSPELAAIAQENIATFCRRSGVSRERFRVVCTDARDFVLPDGPLVLFLYNPFAGAVMAGVIERIEQRVRRSGNGVVVLYRNPVCRALFRASGYFVPLVEGDEFDVYVAADPANGCSAVER